MCKKNLVSLFLLLMLFSFSANSEWALIAKVREGSAYANLKNIKTKNELKVVETMFNTNKVAYLENPREPYMSFYTLDAIDCKTNEFATMQIKYFSEKDAQGLLVASHEDNELLFAEFVKIQPNHPMAKLRKIVCK